MNQTVNGMGSMGRMPWNMNTAPGMGNSAWNRPTMDMSERPGNSGNWNNGPSAGEIFGEMPGSMSGNMSGGMAAGSMSPQAHISTPEETAMRQLDLSIPLPQDAIENPTSLLEARLGSLRALLSRLVGHYVIATFLVGTQSSVSWEGFLYNVGNDYIVIFQPDNGRYVTGDMFSLKFVEFHEEKGVIPACVGSRRRDAQNMW